MRTKASSSCVVFLHLPKTAGTTLKATLRYKHPSAAVVLTKVSDPMGGVEDVPLTRRRHARVVTGHIHYGVHQHIPQDCEYITVLREPIARVISMYHHILRHSKHRFHDELVRSGMGLEEFARSAADPGLDNLQTRMISGRKPGEMLARADNGQVWVAPKLEREDLEIAKRNLERFLVVGLTERFDESFILVRRALGWKLPMYTTRNAAPTVARGPKPEPPTPEAIELIRERNQLDLELYDHAEELFLAALERQGRSFRREVAAFRVLNRVPNTLGPLIPAPLRHPLRSVLPRGA